MLHIIPEWLELLFLTFSIGTLSCRLWEAHGEPAVGFGSGYGKLTTSWRLFGVGIIAIIACSGGDLLVRAAEMTGRSLSSVYPVLPTVVFGTHLGHAWLLRVAVLLSLLLLMQGGKRYRERRPFIWSLLGLLAIAAMTKSASGHSADLGDFNLREIMDWLHLMAVSVWGGGLLVLSTASPAVPGSLSRLAAVAGRFSRIAGISVAVIAVTAAYNAWSLVGSFDALVEAPYGWTILAKTSLFLLLLSLGGFNRYIGIPLLRQASGAAPLSKVSQRLMRIASTAPADRLFISTVRVEALLLLTVLLCSALLRHQVPARHFAHLQHENPPAAHHGGHHPGSDR
jgi:copper resistance protein D